MFKCSFHNLLNSKAINIPHGKILDVIVLQNIAVKIVIVKKIITGLSLSPATLVNSHMWKEAHDFSLSKNPLTKLTIQQDPHPSNQCTLYQKLKGRALARKSQEAVVPASKGLVLG